MITPGKLLLYCYHRPLALARDSVRQGGPWAQVKTAAGRREMIDAAQVMPALPDFATGSAMVVHLMTGRRFWYQTTFCLHSLARASGAMVYAEIYDDGTIDAEVRRVMGRLGPRVRVTGQAELTERLNDLLPAARFPVLRERYAHYVNLRKLIVAHLGRRDWKVVLDSDQLFFRPPYELMMWFRQPTGALHMVDCEESYGYSRALMERLAGRPIPERVNVGIFALRSESIDWAELEAWCAELIAREKTHYYLEQALIAMLMAREPQRVALPARDYLVRPGRAEVFAPTAVLHHYVAESKRWYFQRGWKHAFP